MGRLNSRELIIALIIIAGIIIAIIQSKQSKKENLNIIKGNGNKHYLQSKIKSSGTAYFLWFFFGCHYAYLGKWGLQLLYWFTFGGIFIWAIIDLFTLSGRIATHNALIFQQIASIEKTERDEEHLRNLEMIQAVKGN